MRLNEVSKISWEFYSTRKFVLQGGNSPTGQDLCFLHDEDYKYNPWPDYILVLLKWAPKLSRWTHIRWWIWGITQPKGLGIGNSYVQWFIHNIFHKLDSFFSFNRSIMFLLAILSPLYIDIPWFFLDHWDS